jgi:thiol-disulfide isomerase/thioredoxin
MATFTARRRWRGGAASRRARTCAGWKTALFLLAWCGLAFAATEGQPAPALQAKLLDGTTFNLADDAGKVVIVNLWATWCAPCREEMPALDAYYRQHRDQGLVLVALSMDDPKDEAKVREVTRAYSFPVGLAPGTYLKGYGRIWRLPLTYVVDRQGILRKDQWYGDPGLDAQSLEQTVSPLLRAP